MNEKNDKLSINNRNTQIIKQLDINLFIGK